MTQKPLNQLLRIIIFIFILSFFSCTNKDSKTISIGILEGPSTVSFIKMIHQPPTIEGKEVKFIIKSDPMQIQALMMQNKLDFAVLPTVMAANLYNKGVDYRLLAIPIWGTLYLASNDSTVQCISELKNQTIHVFGQGATADILLQKYLHNNNLQKVKIDYSYSSNHEIAMALLHQKIKLAVVSEPQMSVLLSKDTSIQILTEITCEDRDSIYNKNIFAQTSFLVNNRLSSDYKDLICEVSSAYAESCEYTNHHTDEAAKLLLKLGYYPDLITAFRSIPLCNIHYVPASEIKDKITRYLNIFYNAEPKSVGGKMPDDDFIISQ
jgi:NitT/TauT family transport system substrate-binding protein